MQAHDIPRLSRLLESALGLRAEQRTAFLAALPAADQGLLPLLLELLAEHAQPSRQPLSLPVLGETAEAAEAAGPLAGDLIGPYRLLEKLGQGGMGVVWLAERADGRYQRTVALKLPLLGSRAGEAGLSERMARETAIAARLEHPHIARLYDAGVDQAGRPYFAMECLQGVPIDRHCRAHKLDTRQILSLFLPVLRAVAYAHARLIVHRDIKPANVIVDAQGQAYLLDFGIAHVLTQECPQTSRSASGPPRGMRKLGSGPSLPQEALEPTLHLGLTPGYAAPEQLAGEPITIASDVYSLGLLLYELLAGRLPWEHGTTRRDAPTLLAASARALDPRRAKDLRGALDAVLRKALQPDIDARYVSADALAEDVLRWLAHEPVQAQAASAWLRLRKTVRRHRLAVLAGCVMALSLITAAGVSVAAARRADAASARALAIKDFVIEVFSVGSPDQPGATELSQLPAAALLERSARQLEQRFAAAPLLRAELYGVVGAIFVDMANPQLGLEFARRQLETLHEQGAGPVHRAQASLLMARALIDDDQLAQGLSLAESAAALAPLDALTQVQAGLRRADALVRMARNADAQAALAAVNARLPSLSAGMAVQQSLRAEAAQLEANRLNYLNNQFDAALPLYERAIQAALNAQGAASARAFAIRAALSHALINRHRSAEGQTFLRAALDSQRALNGPTDLAAALLEMSSSKWLYASGQMPYAQARETMASTRALLQSKPKLAAVAAAKLDHHFGALLLEGGDYGPAYALLQAQFAPLSAQTQNPWVQYQLNLSLGRAAMHTGRHPEAQIRLKRALEFGIQSVGAASPWLADGYSASAANWRLQGRLKEAHRFLDGLPALDAVRGEAQTPWRGAEQIAIARAHLALARGEPAQALRELPPLAQLPTGDDWLEDRRLLRGAALCALPMPSQRVEGLALLEAQIKAAAAEVAAHNPLLADWRAQAGLCALALGHKARAVELAALAATALAAQAGGELAPHYRLALQRLQLRLRQS